jgi:MFS family permease
MYDVFLQIPVVGMEVEPFVILLITALAGGAFGAAIGALPAFIFTGFLVFLGEGLAILQTEVGNLQAVPADQLAVGVTGTIGFGPITGPHIAFAGGVAASAYAGKKYPEMEPEDWDYHFGKNILYAFGTQPDILAVGAIFGVVGAVIAVLAGGLGLPTDGIALSVFLTAILARVAFGYPLIGKASGKSILDMSPFEREEPHPAARADGGTVADEHAGRLATEPWLPHQYKWSGVIAIGIVAGILAGFIWLRTGSVFLGYAISAISLLFLNLGVEKIPVTHHITLMGAVGAMIVMPMTGGSAIAALLAAGVVGAFSGLMGELTQRIFYSHSGTHVDPPAMAIVIVMLIVGVLYLVGVVPNPGYLGL